MSEEAVIEPIKDSKIIEDLKERTKAGEFVPYVLGKEEMEMLSKAGITISPDNIPGGEV